MSFAQNKKAARFRALHEGPGTFIIPNPWDAGSARLNLLVFTTPEALRAAMAEFIEFSNHRRYH